MDLYFNTLKKDFLRYSLINGFSKRFNGNDLRFLGGSGNSNDIIEEPTYLGFKISFNNPKFNEEMNIEDNPNIYPTGLLLPETNKYSAYQYLINNKRPKEAQYLKMFRENLLNIEKYTPWFYQKLSGLSDLYKIETGNNFRAKDKKISIETLESMDLRISYIFDLYRKAAWDSEYMRWILPENMREFSMSISIAEIRDFHKIINGAANNESDDFNEFMSNAIDVAFNPQRAASEAKSNVKTSISNSLVGGQKSLNSYSLNSSIEQNTKIIDYNDFLPILELDLHCCKFESVEEGLNIPDLSNQNAESQLTQKITINVGQINEINRYSLFDIILEDFDNNTTSIKTFSNKTDLISGAKDYRKGDLNKSSELKAKSTKWQDKLKDKLIEAGTNKLSGIVQSTIGNLFLGNAYGYSENDLRVIRENLLKNIKGNELVSKQIQTWAETEYNKILKENQTASFSSEIDTDNIPEKPNPAFLSFSAPPSEKKPNPEKINF